MDHWTTALEWTTGALEWTVTSLNFQCQPYTCMHASMERLFGLVAGVASVSFYTTVFVREQCSADCDTLHGYHSRDISWSHTKIITLYYTNVASIVHSFDRKQCISDI